MLDKIFSRWDASSKESLYIQEKAEAGWPVVKCPQELLLDACKTLFVEEGYNLGGIIAEEGQDARSLYYVFYREGHPQRLLLKIEQTISHHPVPSISTLIHGADWIEREIEDLFGIGFRGHPRLGDFVIHSEAWDRTIKPMRKGFDPKPPIYKEQTQGPGFWKPVQIVEGPGVFAMPIGPVYSGPSESVHFLIETVGEEIIRAKTRLFYKYRAVEKLAEGKDLFNGLLLAERFSGTSAFAHALGFCNAVESALGLSVPKRARVLRVILAELERMRHHAAKIEAICSSTGLAVATSHAGILHEELLRISGEFARHRYLFGLVRPGGMSKDFSDSDCHALCDKIRKVLFRLKRLEGMLKFSSSFLDRLEQVGMVSPKTARELCLVGPVGRASMQNFDIRKHLPYEIYQDVQFVPAMEGEGDGYARLRVFFKEARQSARIIEQAAEMLSECRESPVVPASLDVFKDMESDATGIGLIEAPSGAAIHWVRIDRKGRLARYRILPPAFFNWHAFHYSAEGFAFQDFPIILATFGLSVAENDR